MKAIKRLFGKAWFLSLLGVIALALIGILLGPYLDVAGYQPLFSWISRIFFTIILLLVWGLFVLLAMVRGQKKDEEMVEDLAQDAQAEEVNAADEEIEALAGKMAGAMSTLRDQARKGRLGRQYLYELPWYIIIGPPKAGKTTALVNSNLRFPLEDEVGGKRLKGSGGTLDCDWWFTDDAVLLDTAGRYTVQDYDRETTRTAWLGFLDLLKRHRPRRPINGVLVALSLPELLEHDPVIREEHAKAVRARIYELYDNLGVRFPVYLLFTKCDLISGFVEFYDDLSRDERNEVWGFTFPLNLEEDDLDTRFKDEYETLMSTLTYHMLDRLHKEESTERISRIYKFPQQMSVVMDDLREFVGKVFHSDRFHSMPWLRGAYFTSGTQNGNPIDRLVNEMLGEPDAAEVSPARSAKKGRSFFLTRFFEDILFREAEIAGADPKSERRRRWVRLATYAASLSALLLGLATWHTAYRYNEARAEEVGELIAVAEGAVQEHERIETRDGRDDEPGGTGLQKWRAVLHILDPLYQATTAYDGRPWYVAPLGLHRGVDLRGAAERAYDRALSRYLLPALVGAMENAMRGNLDDLDFLYETLASYRTFGDASLLRDLPENRAARIHAWFDVLWNYALQHDRPARENLEEHLERLFAGRINASHLDDPLIQLVQRKIEAIPIEKRAFDFVSDHIDLMGAKDWVLEKALGFEGKNVFVSESRPGLDWRIPGLYTYDGFERLLEQLPDLLDAFKEEQLGLLGTTETDSESLEVQVLSLYYSKYVLHWEEMLQDLQLYKVSTYKDARETTEILAKPSSPLLNLLNALERNTSLMSRQDEGQEDSGTSVELGGVGAISGKLQSLKSRMDAVRRSVTVRGGGKAESTRIGQPVERRFAELGKLVRPQGEVRPIDSPIRTLGSISSHVLEFQRALVKGARDIYEEEYRQALEDLKALQDQSKELPAPVKVWLLGLAQDVREVLTGNACGQLNRLWADQVVPLYERSIEARFPVAKDSETDVKLADFTRFFGPAGVLDKFLTQNLREGLDAVRSQEEMSSTFKEVRIHEAVYEQIRRAAVIKEMFFPYGSTSPDVSFDLTAEEMDPKLSMASLFIGDKKLVYRHDPTRTHSFRWPMANNKTIRLQFSARDDRSLSARYRGEWSLFRLLSDFPPQSITADEYRLNIGLEGYDFVLRLSAESVDNPFLGVEQLQQFRCPLQVCKE